MITNTTSSTIETIGIQTGEQPNTYRKHDATHDLLVKTLLQRPEYSFSFSGICIYSIGRSARFGFDFKVKTV